MDLGTWLWPAPRNNNLKTNWPHIIWNKSLCSPNYDGILVITLNSCLNRIGESCYYTVLIIIISLHIFVYVWASFLSFFFLSFFWLLLISFSRLSEKFHTLFVTLFCFFFNCVKIHIEGTALTISTVQFSSVQSRCCAAHPPGVFILQN